MTIKSSQHGVNRRVNHSVWLL